VDLGSHLAAGEKKEQNSKEKNNPVRKKVNCFMVILILGLKYKV